MKKIRASKICSDKGHDWPKQKTKKGLVIYGAVCQRCGKKHHKRYPAQQEAIRRANIKRFGKRRLAFVRLTAEETKLIAPYPSRWAKFKAWISRLIARIKGGLNVRGKRERQSS